MNDIKVLSFNDLSLTKIIESKMIKDRYDPEELKGKEHGIIVPNHFEKEKIFEMYKWVNNLKIK